MLARRLIPAVVAVLCLLLTGGCWVYTANPLAQSDDELQFDRALLGAWSQPESGCSLNISRFFEEKLYRVDYAAPPSRKGDGCLLDSGKSASFQGMLVEIADNRFLDIVPVDRQPMHHDMTLHSLYRVRVDSATLVLTPLNRDWILSQLEQDRLGLAGRTIADEAVVLTSSTRQLRDFLRDYGNSVEAFPSQGQLAFQRRARP